MGGEGRVKNERMKIDGRGEEGRKGEMKKGKRGGERKGNCEEA